MTASAAQNSKESMLPSFPASFSSTSRSAGGSETLTGTSSQDGPVKTPSTGWGPGALVLDEVDGAGSMPSSSSYNSKRRSSAIGEQSPWWTREQGKPENQIRQKLGLKPLRLANLSDGGSSSAGSQLNGKMSPAKRRKGSTPGRRPTPTDVSTAVLVSKASYSTLRLIAPLTGSRVPC